MLFRNALLFPVSSPEKHCDFSVKDGKFARIATHLEPEAGEETIDLQGLRVYPGMVEAHCHLGLEDSSIGYESLDVNEMSHSPLTPQMRGIDGINPLDETVSNALKAGVTTVASGPGSANVVGGTFCAWKTMGTCIDDMVIQDPVAMKAAFGENPKRVYRDKAINTRMGIAALLRDLLDRTAEYRDRKIAAGDDVLKKPAYDAGLEAMIPVIEKELPLKCHAHQHNDILTVLRIAKEYDLKVTLDHCTDGELIVDAVQASGFPAIIGPSLTHKSKHELMHKSFTTPGVFYRAGIPFAITTDSPVIPQEYLSLCAGLACQAGLPEEAAIRAVTLSPAEILGLDHRIGSIEEGKDADFIITDSSLLNPYKSIHAVYVNGIRAF